MYNFLLLVSTEMLGYGLAGICRRWLVYPSDMIWPSALQSVNFLNTMHRDKNEPVGRWTISRYRLFFWSLLAMFLYSFIPQLVTFFKKLPILTMIWPKSKTVNLIFGVEQGLNLLPLTLSYQTIIAFLGMALESSEVILRVSAVCSCLWSCQHLCGSSFLVLDGCWDLICYQSLV
jgi:hypothetical protein